MKSKKVSAPPRPQRSLALRQPYITKTTSGWMIMLLICCLSLLSPLVSAYNIDIPSYTKHQRPESNTMFGFSIALHKGRSGPQTNSLVVGAPKFDTSSYQEGVIEAGAVFNCGMNDGDCNLVKFDSSSNNRNTQGDVIDRKSYQWLGATVATSRDNDLVVACAPRYVFHTITPKKNLRWDPIGTCFTTRNFTHFNEVSPCRTNNWGYHRQGYCQAGFSAAASGVGDRLYVGAPGSWYWQGQAYSVSPDATFPYKPPFYQPFGTGGQTYSYDVTRPENQVYSTAESSSADDDSYLGYSMVTGDFNGDRAEDIAIGMPRGAGLLGKIVVNKWNMVNLFNITGRQIGEYFGYAMATSDVDGDGLDDLIIGAPMYSEPGNAEGKYDVGRVYILLQTSTNDRTRWSTEHIRDGFNTKGRFGLALTTLGDINRDGYGDFAVGAPYDGPFGRGIVYIFHGSANGPLVKPSQIIKSEDIVEGAPYPRTFGFALSGGLDMDGNTYPDLAVGAYASDQVFIFKSRPVAAVNAMTSFDSPSKLINIEEKHCQTVRDGKRVACTSITTCWSYTGEYLPNVLEFDVSWVLDAKKPKNPRMFFLLDEGRNIRNMTITLAAGKNFCRNETVYLIDNVQDKLTPLEVETRYNLRSSRSQAPLVRRRRGILEPVIDQNREIVQRDAINIQKNCGADNICEPDLRLEIKTVDKYLLGSREPLSIEVLISNMNEDAFEAAFYMVMPKDLDFKKIQQIGDKTDTPITCTAPSEVNNYTLKCDIGNPLQSKKVSNFKVIMLPSQKVGMAPSYDFFMEANSTNVEKPGSHFDNIIRKSISIWVETDLAIDGTSLPDFALYKASDYQPVENATKEEDLGPQVVHLYNIFNKGPSTIDEAIVFIHYPYQTAAGDYLMYMTNQPETHGNIQCDPHINVNALNLQLDQNLVRKSYLEERGAVIKSQGVYESSKVFIEKSHGQNQGGANVVAIGRGKQLSKEETIRLEKEDEQAATGDASFVHSQRANAAAQGNIQGGGSSSGSWAWSWNSTGTGSGPSVVVQTKNSSVYYDERGQPHVVESSTEYVTSLDSIPRTYQHSQQSSANYQQAGAASGQQQQQFQQAQGQAQMGAHNARGHIQMASPQGSTQYQRTYVTSGAPQRVQYSSSSSSGNAYRPQQQNHRVGSAATYNDFAAGDGNFEKAAVGGRGFQSGTLDLGALNRGNVEQELRTHSVQPQQGSYNYHQTYSSGTPQTNANYHQASSSSYGGSKPYYGLENEDYYDEDYNSQTAGGQQGAQSSQKWSHSSSSSQPLRRVRREESEVPEPTQIDMNSPCKAAKCETLRCVARNLGKDDGVWIAIRTRMVAHTMEKLASNVPLNVSTMAVSHVTKLPYIGEPKDDIIRTHEIFYKAIPEPTPVPDVVPLWVVVLAACAGALILLLLIFLLYKCGFFNRNRPTDHSMERQPLRNGYHADEHL
ncbi:Integrin alpha-PS2 [Lucilia cuprina]|uniref:Integrin alpha-PS2 n=1 Tax=Lucilia cuprina TaxID=7375 RepID=A0A0L0BN51_LUCCU|nr:Integrin alpha-PS2 [Lucilia cuprina]KNC20704.1 Integrin alpha-PS2 [Lucilia cuprina]